MSLYRVRVNWFGASMTGPAVSTFFFDAAAGTAAQAVTALGTCLTSISAKQSTSLSYASETAVDELDETDGSLLSFNTVSPISGAGAIAGDFLPPQIQLRVGLNTTTIVNGRRLAGRNFIPGWPESQNISGFPDSVLTTAVNGFVNTLIANANCALSVWSRTHGVAIPAVAADTWVYWADLRSRRD